MSVKIDLIDGAQVRRTSRGIECSRIARVTGITGSASEIQWQALNTSGIPPIGDSHPVIPGVKVDEHVAGDATNEACFVTIIYRTPNADFGGAGEPQVGEPPQIEIGAAVTTVQTQKDAFGADLELNPTDPDGTISQDDDGNDIKVVATISKQVPQPFIRYTRRETTSAQDLLVKAITYVGKTNTSPLWGADASQWLCTHIIGRSKDNGVTYQTDYEFQYATNIKEGDGGTTFEMGWDTTIRAEVDGKPQADPVEDVSIKDIVVYLSEDFADLGLT